jgi:hypothetical protein
MGGEHAVSDQQEKLTAVNKRLLFRSLFSLA